MRIGVSFPTVESARTRPSCAILCTLRERLYAPPYSGSCPRG